MDELASRIVAEGLSVRAVEEIIAMGRYLQGRRKKRTPRPVATPNSPMISAIA